MILDLLPDEVAAIDDLAAQHRAAAWIVTPAVRLGITLGVKRAIVAAQGAPKGGELAAIEDILN